MNKTRIMALVLIVLAMIPMTYVIGRGRRDGRDYHHQGRGYRHGGYYGRVYGPGFAPIAPGYPGYQSYWNPGYWPYRPVSRGEAIGGAIAGLATGIASAVSSDRDYSD